MIDIFGYIRINKMDLTFREFDNYKSFYCGLCKVLKRDYTELSRLSINYDITFLILILTSLYKPESRIYFENCIVNPLKKKPHIENEFTRYAAAMNILLTYGKLDDNVRDRGSLLDKMGRMMYKNSYKKALEDYPEKAAIIQSCLEQLYKIEEENSQNIDLTSNTFGEIMREVFKYRDDEYSDRLGDIGFNIGKYIYIIDAFEDLDKDLKNDEYNPFKVYMNDRDELRKKVERNLMMCLSGVEYAINGLGITVNKRIIDNIIYSGVYLRFKKIVEKS